MTSADEFCIVPKQHHSRFGPLLGQSHTTPQPSRAVGYLCFVGRLYRPIRRAARPANNMLAREKKQGEDRHLMPIVIGLTTFLFERSESGL